MAALVAGLTECKLPGKVADLADLDQGDKALDAVMSLLGSVR